MSAYYNNDLAGGKWNGFVDARIDNPRVRRSQLSGFVEANGYVSMEAAHASRRVSGNGVSWLRIPGTGSHG